MKPLLVSIAGSKSDTSASMSSSHILLPCFSINKKKVTRNHVVLAYQNDANTIDITDMAHSMDGYVIYKLNVDVINGLPDISDIAEGMVF